jgi:hypothetical protein
MTGLRCSILLTLQKLERSEDERQTPDGPRVGNGCKIAKTRLTGEPTAQAYDAC